MKLRHMLAATAAATLMAAAPSVAKNHTPKGNIVAAAQTSAQHQTLVKAVKAAGLVSTLASGGPLTVFAPTDAAFAKLPAGTLDTLLQPANKDQLKSVLTYHVVEGKVTSADLVKMINDGGGSATITTVEGSTLTARLDGNSVVIEDESGNTATVVTADMMQSNGVIHVTDVVFIPA